AVPRDRGGRRGDARGRRGRAGARPRGPARGRRGGARARKPRGCSARTLGRVTIVAAILGLAVLVLVHEAGHFFVARAVGLRPRRFYVGFPPALVKTTRNGIEYGIGSIPLGGYVKIPGMHRPAPQDLDAHVARALEEAPSLVAPLERVKAALARGDLEAA